LGLREKPWRGLARNSRDAGSDNKLATVTKKPTSRRSAEHDHGEEEALRTIGRGRSPKWPAVERAFRKLHSQCVCCIVKSITHIQIHHRFPFHYCVALGRPDLELDPRNLITLCEGPSHTSPNHHELVGHLADWKSSDLEVAEDAITFRGMSEAEIRADKRWIAKVATRLVQLDKMTPKDKAAFTKRMNATFPLAPSASSKRVR
jgi:hypothetical protein